MTASILGIGGAHIDRRGQVGGTFVPGASNPGAMREDVGGGTFNALRTAVSRGASGALVSVRGGDAAGETVARAIAAAGIGDLSVTFLDRVTPSYTAILSREGDVVAALADMSLYDVAFPKQMRRAALRIAAGRAGALLCDANLPQSALARLPGLAQGKPIFAIAISPAKAVRLACLLPSLACLFLNMREAAALLGRAKDAPAGDMVSGLRALGLERAVLTDGSHAVVAFDTFSTTTITPPAPRRVVDVTGAGDALTGASIAALLAGLPFVQAVRHGMAAAMLAVESAASVPTFSEAEFAQALALVPEGTALHQGASQKESDVT